MKAQEDPDWEMTIGAWINKVITPSMLSDVCDLYTSLKDGLLLIQYVPSLLDFSLDDLQLLIFLVLSFYFYSYSNHNPNPSDQLKVWLLFKFW